MTDYVDRCLCGYFVTQEEIDEGSCPECGIWIRNLSQQWERYEELAQPQVLELEAESYPEIWKLLQPPSA